MTKSVSKCIQHEYTKYHLKNVSKVKMLIKLLFGMVVTSLPCDVTTW